jgi:hypothetical protein
MIKIRAVEVNPYKIILNIPGIILAKVSTQLMKPKTAPTPIYIKPVFCLLVLRSRLKALK